MPAEFWTSGWHLWLSGPAVVALLVLEHMNKTKPNPKQTELWVNPTLRETHFGFSEDTWYKGANELVAHGLASRKAKIIRQPFEDESRRRRCPYEFEISNLKTAAPIPDPHRLILEEEKAEEAF